MADSWQLQLISYQRQCEGPHEGVLELVGQVEPRHRRARSTNGCPTSFRASNQFVSTGDIDKERRWSEVLASELAQIGYGIIILTRDNVREPWINFEAGAISKAIDKSWVSPFLFGVEPSKLEGPLQQFQATIYEQEDIFNPAAQHQLPPRRETIRSSFEVLRNEFDVWWPKLRKRIDEILATQEFENETGFDWLFTTKDLRAAHEPAEARVDRRAASVPQRAGARRRRDVIQQNLKAGLIYVHHLRRRGRRRAPSHRRRVPGPGARARARGARVPERGVTDYFILDPDSDAVAVFLELPIQTRAATGSRSIAKPPIGLVERFRSLRQPDPADARSRRDSRRALR